MAAMLLLLLSVTVEVRAQSALDGFDPNADGSVWVVVVQPDGKVLIGGSFTTLSPNGGAAVTRNLIARLNPDGTLDNAFNPNAVGFSIDAIAVQADGKILVGGRFTGMGGQARNNIARLDPATGLADSFAPNADGWVHAIAVQADGRILAGGGFTNIGGQARPSIARLDPTTGLVDSFDANVTDDVYTIAVQADGKILVGGHFFGANSIGGKTRNRIARLDATTGQADSFDPNANGNVYAIVVQPDGRILVGGAFNGANGIGGQTRNRIARLDPTTGLADSFDPDANAASVDSIALQADGKVLAGGGFSSIGGQPRDWIARLDPTTGLADAFDPNPNSAAYSIAVQADGKILIGGPFTTVGGIGGQARNRIARVEADGRLDQTLDLGLFNRLGDAVYATAIQPNGKILIGGKFFRVLGVNRNNIARLNSDGTLDLAFNPNANDVVISLAIQADGKILVGGQFTTLSPNGGMAVGRNHIARLNPDGTVDPVFNPDANGEVYAIGVQVDGKILVGGSFLGANSIGGQARNRIARLDPTTGLADSFDPNAELPVYAIAIQADGAILAGGLFTHIGGQVRNHIARLDPTTGLADSFDPNANNVVFSLAVQADGKILAGGAFNQTYGMNTIGGQTRNFIARLDAVTGLADSFDPNANANVYSIALQADGKVLAGGEFNGANSIGGQARNYIARLDAASGLADSFNPDANDHVDSIAVQTDGKILAGGGFASIGGQPRTFFARLTNDTAALQNLIVTQTRITWIRGGSSPQFTRVAFEYSTDNVDYTPLGNGAAAGSDWSLLNLSFSTGQNFYIRARGHYRSGYGTCSESIAESVRNAFLFPGALGNISTRLRVETGDNILIGGFIITGTEPKKIILRAIGPSLSSFFPGALADPVLELRNSSGGLIASNNNWRSDQEAEIIATTIPPANDLESAIVATLPANSSAYTAIVRGLNNGTGIGLVEVYDLDRAMDSKLANTSTRGFVQAGDNVLIGGLMVLGQNTLRVVVRAIGPSLPVPGVLGDPALELHDGNGALIAVNDNWRSDQEAEIIATGIPPSSDRESAIVGDFAPGNYTAIVRGVNNTTGIALVEAYGLN